MSFFSDLSKHLVLPVHRPALFFHNRENVDLKDMSVLELMSVLDQSSWTKSEEVKAIRKLEPYDCTTKLPKVYFVKGGGIPAIIADAHSWESLPWAVQSLLPMPFVIILGAHCDLPATPVCPILQGIDGATYKVPITYKGKGT